MSTTKDKTVTAPAPVETAKDAVRIMAKRNASISAIIGAMEENAKNHEQCIAQAKLKDAFKTGKTSITDTEGNTVRFLDPSTFRNLAKTYGKTEKEMAWKKSMIRCADYLTALEYLTKAGVI